MKDLKQQALEIVAEKVGRNENTPLEWTINELMAAQGEMIADRPDFWILAGREACRRAVREAQAVYNEKSVKEAGDQQLMLEGYKHLRVAYLVEDELIPLVNMSREQLLERAALFVRQAGSMMDHAREIERYVAKLDSKRAA